MAAFMFLSVSLRPAGSKLPSPVVYRSVSDLISLFLNVFWITKISADFCGVQKINALLIQPYTPNETHLHWIRCKKMTSSQKL